MLKRLNLPAISFYECKAKVLKNLVPVLMNLFSHCHFWFYPQKNIFTTQSVGQEELEGLENFLKQLQIQSFYLLWLSVPDVCVWQVAVLPKILMSPCVGDSWLQKTFVQTKQQTAGRLLSFHIWWEKGIIEMLGWLKNPTQQRECVYFPLTCFTDILNATFQLHLNLTRCLRQAG